MKKRYPILVILWPVFIVSLVLALPTSNDDAEMILGLNHGGQELLEIRFEQHYPALGGVVKSDSGRIPDSAVVAVLLLGTGLVGLVGISRKKGG